MFKNTYQAGFLSVLYSIGSKPLELWDTQTKNGHIKRITDPDIQSSVLELVGANVSTNYITCPKDPKKTLGIKLPFLVMIIKNMKKYFSFELTVRDDKNVRRRFRASNYQSTTRVKPFICTMPMRLDDGWNQIQFNLSDFTRRAYSTNYIETLRIQVHANCRIRRIYFSDKLIKKQEDLPREFQVLLAVPKAPSSTGTGFRARQLAQEHRARTTGKAAEIEAPADIAQEPIDEEPVADELVADEPVANESNGATPDDQQAGDELVDATAGVTLDEPETQAPAEEAAPEDHAMGAGADKVDGEKESPKGERNTDEPESTTAADTKPEEAVVETEVVEAKEAEVDQGLVHSASEVNLSDHAGDIEAAAAAEPEAVVDGKEEHDDGVDPEPEQPHPES
jgi:cilia- and flagella-associated protein 20